MITIEQATRTAFHFSEAITSALVHMVEEVNRLRLALTDPLAAASATLASMPTDRDLTPTEIELFDALSSLRNAVRLALTAREREAAAIVRDFQDVAKVLEQ